ncbi:Hydrogenase-2 operon protein HybG [Aquicella siphonis]|uniref:Hydrogenase-2 operon protein HybG n=2 Tax=Aquicella siphonis TaxID=254247 RepID=A0A5E4PGD8_9COXI|nr:Hydrogenase-2 operon protein HybG [Aquicella siphonis]
MCLALPAQVIELLEDQRAIVSLGGVRKEISTSLLETVSAGEYVIIHVGYALTRLDEQEAQKTLQLFADLFQEGNDH